MSAGRRSLCVVTTYFNPANYRSRLRNYHAFAAGVREVGAPLLTVELAFGRQPFALEEGAGVLQVRTDDVLWQKERLLNLALGHLPPGADSIAWADADILFAWPDWPARALALLEQFPAVQLFDQVVYGPEGPGHAGSVFVAPGAAFQAARAGDPFGGHAHGIAWAARRELLEKHGFYDACVVGGGDTAMMLALYGLFEHPWLEAAMSERLRRHYERWARPLFADVQGRVSYLPVTAYHLWHGHVQDRDYVGRWRGLRDFDPEADLRVGADGCWHWATDKKGLHEWVAGYFARRNEDAPF